MKLILILLAAVCLAIGVFFALIGVLGVLKFPEYFSRAQAATCITTMGALGALASGLIFCIDEGLPAVWYVKLFIIAAMLLVSSAVSGHSLTKGSYKRGHRPHFGGFVKDDYKEDGFDDVA